MYFSLVLLEETPVKSRKPLKSKHKGDTSLKVSIGRNQLADSCSSQQGSAMTVQVPRSKLRGSLGQNFQSSNCLIDYRGVPVNMVESGELMLPPSYADYSVDERMDQVAPLGKPHKRLYKLLVHVIIMIKTLYNIMYMYMYIHIIAFLHN